MNYELQILSGPDAGSEIPLTDEEIIIGRDPKCHVVIRDRSVSRTHARIYCDGKSYLIADCRSRNGTRVNGRKIHSSVRLRHNDEILVCTTEFVFRSRLPMAAASKDEDSTAVVDAIDVSDSTRTALPTQAEEKLQALLHLIELLRGTLELDEVLSRSLDGVFGVFSQAYRGLVLLQEGKELSAKVVKSRGAVQEPVYYCRPIVEKAMADRQGILGQEARGDTGDTCSVLCVPLLSSDGVAMGVIQVETETNRSEFNVDDLQILNCAATQLSVAIENAKLHRDLVKHERLRKELDFARAVQHGFLPKSNPELPGYQFWAFYEPARQVGGDFLDFVHLPNGDLAVLLGDAAGKGIPASLVMAKVSTLCKLALCREPNDLPAAMRIINQETCESRVGSMVTLAICRVSPTENMVTMCSAGHMSPIIRRVDANLYEPLDYPNRGLPLGVDNEAAYGAVKIPLAEGEYVLLYSDGLTDAMNFAEQRYSKQGICKVISQTTPADPATLGQVILDDVRNHENGREQVDDTTLVVFNRESAAGGA